MKTGVSYYTSKSQEEIDKEFVDKVKIGTEYFQRLVPELIGGYHQLRAQACEQNDLNKIAYYDGLIAGVAHTHNHWIELMK